MTSKLPFMFFFITYITIILPQKIGYAADIIINLTLEIQ